MMERSFDMSDFEQSLKDHADQFMLVPSKRVWNGIYNNLHPGSKWPSITVALVLLITLITIGNLNNSPKKFQKNQTTNTASFFSKDQSSKATNTKDSYSENSINSKKKELLTNALNGFGSNNIITGRNQENIINQKSIKNDNSTNVKSEIATGPDKTNGNNNSKQSIPSINKNISSLTEISEPLKLDDKNSGQTLFSIANITNNKQDQQQYLNLVNTGHVDEFNSFLFDQRINTTIEQDVFANFQNSDNIIKETLNSIKNDLAIPAFNLEKNTNAVSVNAKKENHPDNTTLHKHKKRNNKIEWTYYVTPVISNAAFRGKGIEPPANNYSPIVIYQTPSNNGMIYHAKLGFETGAKMTYSLSKKLKFVTGFNLNYSDYNIISNLLHPTFATLMFKDKSSGSVYSKNYITFYGNGQSLNQIALTNYSLQASIPVGFQYQIWGNKKTQINIVSTIEPSLVVKSNSYIISADKRYYVNDPSLMRKVNLGGNFGAFVTFSARKVKWHIGPDIHYQLLSTYKNYYPIKEHLINYGIRIGISK
ncbi:MAG TPA: hypothetical protein VFI29_22880 [Hanamia sp.]|nr:hypothetical protein [Hanamia sp.]